MRSVNQSKAVKKTKSDFMQCKDSCNSMKVSKARGKIILALQQETDLLGDSTVEDSPRIELGS